jgi:hypothetical protein
MIISTAVCLLFRCWALSLWIFKAARKSNKFSFGTGGLRTLTAIKPEPNLS